MGTTAKEVQLLKKCLKGNSQAFEGIVAKYQELICAITFSGVTDVQQSEELAHQTFINAWNKLPQLKDLAKFRPWLCTIARNNIRNFFDKSQRDIIAKAKPMENINDTAAAEAGPLESTIKKEHEELVSDAIRRIPEQYREPLVLYYRQQKSVKQVAQALDLSEDVVKQRLQRGRKMLKEQLGSIVEKTLSATGPKKGFTAAVIASVAGMAIKGSGVAPAAGIAAGSSTTGSATGFAAVMSGVTGKIITAAAVVAIGVGAVVTYKHITKRYPEPEFSQAGMIVQEQGDEQEKITEEVTAQFSKEKTSPPDARSANAIVQNDNQTKPEMNGTQNNEPETLADNNIRVLSDSPYDYFLFTLLSRSEETRTLVLVELTDEGFQLQNIDTNSYGSYRWDEVLCVTDGILYGVRNGDLLSMDLAASGNGGFAAIGFDLRSEYTYADGRFYGQVGKGENTKIYRALDFKKKAYRDVTPLKDNLNYFNSWMRQSLAVSPDHKRLAFFVEDPNGYLVTVLEMDSGEISQANKPIKWVIPGIASSFYLPPVVWLDTEKVLTIRTEQTETDPNNLFGGAVHKLTFLDITTGEIEDILSLPGDPHWRWAPYLIQDYAEPGPRVCMRHGDLGDYRLDAAAGTLVENDTVNGDYLIYKGYLFHGENDLGPVERKHLKVSLDGKRAIWISDGKLLFHDIAAKTIQVVTEKKEAEGVLLWLTKEDLRAVAETESLPEGWIAFKDHSQPEPERKESRPRRTSQIAMNESFTLTLETDKAQYQLHEPIELTVTLTNKSNVDVNVFQPAVFGLGCHTWDGLSLDYPGGSRHVQHGAQPYEPKAQHILLRTDESVSATDMLELAMVGDYQVKCRYEAPKDNNYRGYLIAGPIGFSVNAVDDAEREKQLFEAKFGRLMERFRRELELAPGWNGANNTVGDKLIGIPGMGPAAATYLIEVLNNEENDNARNLLYRALTAVADGQSLPFFRERLSQGESEPVCEWLCDLYCKKRDANEVADEPLTVLLSGMKHEDAGVRRDVTGQLVRIYDPRVVSCFEMAVEDSDEKVRVKAARYLAATEWLDLTEWFELATEQPTYARYIATRSIIKELERKWNITKGLLPDIPEENFTDNNEKLKRFSEIVDEWQKWASENPRFSFYFFDNDREDWLEDQSL